MSAPCIVGYQQSLAYTATKDRKIINGLAARRDTANTLSGAIPQATGPFNASRSGFTVTVTHGAALIGAYTFIADGNSSLTVDPTTGTARRDLIIARIYDTEAGDLVSEGKVEIVKGTTTTDPAIPANSLLLWQVDVPASGSSVTLVDRRTYTTAAGASKPILQIADAIPTDQTPGAPIYDQETGLLWYRHGSSLKRLGAECIASGVASNDTTVEVRSTWYYVQFGPLVLPSYASWVEVQGTFTLNVLNDGATDLAGAFGAVEVFHAVCTHHSDAGDTNRTYSWTGRLKNKAAGSYSGCYLGLFSGAGAIIHVKNLSYSWAAFG